MLDQQITVGAAREILRRRLKRSIYSGYTNTDHTEDVNRQRALEGSCGSCKHILPIQTLEPRGVQMVRLRCSKGYSPEWWANSTPPDQPVQPGCYEPRARK